MKKILSGLLGIVMVISIPINSNALVQDEDRYINSYYRSCSENRIGAVENYDAVIVISDESANSDGLSASGLAGATNGIIYAHSVENDVPGRMSSALEAAKDKPIYFVGGPKVIPYSVRNHMESKGFDCRYIEGENRIETSYAVAKEIEKITGGVNEIAITRAYKGEADAISIAHEAKKRKMPVILTNGSSVPFDTSNLDKVYAIGGNKVISDKLVKDTNAVRISGANRFLTNKAVIKYFGSDKNKSYVVVPYEDESYALIASCVPNGNPVVLISDYSDKTILEGAEKIKYVYASYEDVNMYVKATCENATYGKSITDAMYKIYKTTGHSKNDYAYIYNPIDNYVGDKSFKSEYYIFSELNINNVFDYDESDYNILVRKSDGKIFTFGPGDSKPIQYRKY